MKVSGVFGSRASWSQRGAIGVGALLSIVAVVSGLLVGSGNASRLLDLGDGRGWISDNSPGGSAGVAGVSVGSATTDWRSVGAGIVKRVVAGADGLVWAQVDMGGGRFEWRRVGKDKATSVSPAGAAGDQVAVTGGGVSWLVDTVRSRVLLLTDGGPSEAMKVGSSIRSSRGADGVAPVAAVDGKGRLVVVSVSSVVVFGRSGDTIKRLGRFDVPEGVSGVVTVGDRVVLVSRKQGSALVLDGARSGTRLRLGASGVSLLVPERSSGSVLWVVDPSTRRVVGTHVDGRRVGELPLPDVEGATWSSPVVVGDVVMVSAQAGGRLHMWRGAAGSGFHEVDLKELGEIGSCEPACAELFESGGRLWVNQSTSPSVGVVDAAGVVRTIWKARPSSTGEGEGRGAGATPDHGAKAADTAFGRIDVPPMPYRKPPVSTPQGAALLPGSNPGNPTQGEPGDPTTKDTINRVPDEPNLIDGGPAVAPPSAPPPEPHLGACESNQGVIGDQSQPPGSPSHLTGTATKAVGRRGEITVTWLAPVDGGQVCAYFIHVIDGPMRPEDGMESAENTTHRIVDLEPGLYKIAVGARNNAGLGPAVETSVEVPQDPPPPDPTIPGPDLWQPGTCWQGMEPNGDVQLDLQFDGPVDTFPNVRWFKHHDNPCTVEPGDGPWDMFRLTVVRASDEVSAAKICSGLGTPGVLGFGIAEAKLAVNMFHSDAPADAWICNALLWQRP